MGSHGPDSNQNMKVLALISCIALAAAEPTCDECLASVGRLVERITGEESLAEQAAILTGALCPAAPNPAECEEALPVQWPLIGTVLFPEFLQADAVCGDTGVCSLFKEITCEDCEAGVAYITGLMGDADQIAAAVDFLLGDFCEGSSDPAFCKERIPELIPAAMNVLAAAFTETQIEICQDVNGVC